MSTKRADEGSLKCGFGSKVVFVLTSSWAFGPSNFIALVWRGN